MKTEVSEKEKKGRERGRGREGGRTEDGDSRNYEKDGGEQRTSQIEGNEEVVKKWYELFASSQEARRVCEEGEEKSAETSSRKSEPNQLQPTSVHSLMYSQSASREYRC